MRYPILLFLSACFLVGCVQPKADPERPVVRGAYLVIEGREARAVVVRGAQRWEEQGRVIDKIRLAGSVPGDAGGYVIDTPNCGQLQWLPQPSTGGRPGRAARLFLPTDNASIHRVDCVLSKATQETWTALDYSG